MIKSSDDFETEEFRGNYNEVRHWIRTKRFDYAAKPLLVGWDYQAKGALVTATKKRLADTWGKKQRLMKEAGFTTDDLVNEVLGDVEDWLRELYEAGEIKKMRGS
jgi:hypothetical protein